MNGFVEVYSKTTGLKQTVPEHWMSDPILSQGFSTVPAQPVYGGKNDASSSDAIRGADALAVIDAPGVGDTPDSTTETSNPSGPPPVPGDQGTHQED